MINIQSVANAVPSGTSIGEPSLAQSVAPPEPERGILEQKNTDQAPSLAQVGLAVGDINKTLQLLAPSLEFSVDADSKRTVVKVVDRETKEVIRQMPSAEALAIAKALDHVQGLLIRQKG